MPFKAPKPQYELHPVGMFAGTCYQVIDLGTHIDPHYGKMSRKVKLSFETSKKMKDGRAFSVQTRYNYTMGKKGVLREHLEMWRGKQLTNEEAENFDLFAVLGKPALLNIQLSEDGRFANIMSLNPIPEGMQVPERKNPLLKFYLAEFDQTAFDKLGQRDRDFINESDERNPDKVAEREAAQQANEPEAEADPIATVAAADAPNFDDSEIPF